MSFELAMKCGTGLSALASVLFTINSIAERKNKARNQQYESLMLQRLFEDRFTATAAEIREIGTSSKKMEKLISSTTELVNDRNTAIGDEIGDVRTNLICAKYSCLCLRLNYVFPVDCTIALPSLC